ncbi:MAG: IgA Peptidase M64 [Bacteroidaceae bacterium]|nr:IgA Peptidase M64 [Bacteroidaceae bacterium]
MKKMFIAAWLLLASTATHAQQFEDYFSEQTLRVDYVFTGNEQGQQIALDELIATPGWAGRRHHLAEMPLKSHGQLVMRDKETGQPIYATSFSSLFQEWTATDEAKEVTKSYENCFLMPFPKKVAEVEVTLMNYRHEVVATLKHTIDPNDILIHQKGKEHVTLYKYMVQNGTPEECIDIAILAEGYKPEEMELFYEDAAKVSEFLFSYEPFKSLQKKFNFIAVASPSEDSGVSIPKKGEWKHTAFSSNYSTFYSDRYLTTSHLKAVHDALAGIPYEHIIVLANTDEYGGGGIYNSLMLTAAHHSTFRPVVVHEFGHSFAGLADEYFYDDDVMSGSYPLDIEPWEANITTLVDFDSKWKDLMKKGTPIPTIEQDTPVGIFEGGGYSSKGVYRPAYDCRMRTNSSPEFCPVCDRAIRRIIEFYTE